MGFDNLLALLGGLALFLYGMQMMSTGLEAAAGDRMKQILEKLTSNRILAVLVGAGITAVIQSSSATTVMVVGFVNARMMTLRQAVWIIMGANIGTTITGQLIALDIGALAPLFAFIGVAMVVFVKNPKVGHWGQILAGLGVLFIGMDMMSGAMVPLRESELFISWMTNFSNPLIGILVGAGFTALIQSSSASVGILQALAATGLIDLGGAVYILFGQNIGTCITAILASIGTSREAKQTTVIHLSFNIIGTVLFTIICMVTPLTSIVAMWTPANAQAQIANMHTLFNIVTTLLLLPFGGYLADFAQRVLPSEDMKKDAAGLLYLQPLPNSNKIIGASAINMQQVNDEVLRMMDLAYQNVDASYDILMEYDEKIDKEIENREKTVNFLNTEIANYISEVLSDTSLNNYTLQALSGYYLMLADIERISDYAINLTHRAKELMNKKLSIDELDILNQMKRSSQKMRDSIFDLTKAQTKDREIDHLTHSWRNQQIQSLKTKTISSEVALVFSRILTDYERINDHSLNVAEYIEKVEENYHESILEA